MLPAHAGMILDSLSELMEKPHVTRTRGDDPVVTMVHNYYILMLPAHAGMILLARVMPSTITYVTRTRGDDPI